MGKRIKGIVSVLLLLLLSCCFTTGLLVGAEGSTPSAATTTTLSMRPLLRDAADGRVISHIKRVLLTTRNAPIGFPPPPAITTPPSPGY